MSGSDSDAEAKAIEAQIQAEIDAQMSAKKTPMPSKPPSPKPEPADAPPVAQELFNRSGNGSASARGGNGHQPQHFSGGDQKPRGAASLDDLFSGSPNSARQEAAFDPFAATGVTAEEEELARLERQEAEVQRRLAQVAEAKAHQEEVSAQRRRDSDAAAARAEEERLIREAEAREVQRRIDEESAAAAAAAAAEETRRLEEEAIARRVAEEQARMAEEARIQAEVQRQREAEEMRQAEKAEAQRRIEEEARIQAEVQRRAAEAAAAEAAAAEAKRLEEEAIARRVAEEAEIRRRAEEAAAAEAQRRAEEEEARIQAEVQRRREEDEARRRFEAAEAKRLEEEAIARRTAEEEEIRRRAEEAAVAAAAAEAQRRAEEEARLRREAEELEIARRAAEAEAARLEEEATARRVAEEEARIQAEMQRQQEEQERRRQEYEAEIQRQHDAEVQREKDETEARRRAEEEERLIREAEERELRRIEEASAAAAAARRKEQEEIARRIAEEEARIAEEAEARRRAEEAAAAEAQRRAEEEARLRREAEEREIARRAAEAEAKEKAEQEAKEKEARIQAEVQRRLRERFGAAAAATLATASMAKASATTTAEAAHKTARDVEHSAREATNAAAEKAATHATSAIEQNLSRAGVPGADMVAAAAVSAAQAAPTAAATAAGQYALNNTETGRSVKTAMHVASTARDAGQKYADVGQKYADAAQGVAENAAQSEAVQGAATAAKAATDRGKMFAAATRVAGATAAASALSSASAATAAATDAAAEAQKGASGFGGGARGFAAAATAVSAAQRFKSAAVDGTSALTSQSKPRGVTDDDAANAASTSSLGITSDDDDDDETDAGDAVAPIKCNLSQVTGIENVQPVLLSDKTGSGEALPSVQFVSYRHEDLEDYEKATRHKSAAAAGAATATTAPPPKATPASAPSPSGDGVLAVQYDTPREAGRCLAPGSREPGLQPPAFSSQKMHVDFFRARQTVLCPSSVFAKKGGGSGGGGNAPGSPAGMPSVDSVSDLARQNTTGSGISGNFEGVKSAQSTRLRENVSQLSPNGHEKELLSKFVPAYERFASGDSQGSNGAASGDAPQLKAAWDHCSAEQIFPDAARYAENPAAAIGTHADRFGAIDAMLLHEQGRTSNQRDGKGMTPATPFNTGKLPTDGRMYVGDYEPAKPVPSVGMYANGALLKIDVRKIETKLHEIHGNAIDPLYFTLQLFALYPSQPCRIAEPFYFGNKAYNEKHMGALPSHRAFEIPSFVAWVPPEHRGSRIFLVIKAHRLATNDGDTIVDAYYRPHTYKEKHVAEHRRKTQQFADAKFETLTLFGWNYIPLNADQQAGKYVSGTQTLDKLLANTMNKPLSDALLNEYWSTDAKRNALKTIPGNFHFDVTTVTGYEISTPHRRDASWPYEQETILEVQHPDQAGAPRVPVRHCAPYQTVMAGCALDSYSNAMTVRLHHLNLAKLNMKTKYPLKSFVVQVALKDSDDTAESEGVPCVISRRFTQSSVASSGWSTVTLDNRDVDFDDEFKILLPSVLTERHHLFFTIYGMCFDSVGARPLELVGYGILPIFTSNVLLVQEPTAMPILLASEVKSALPGYLMRRAQLAPASYVAQAQGLFSVSTVVRSSLYACEAPLAGLFGRVPQIVKEAAKRGSVYSPSSQEKKQSIGLLKVESQEEATAVEFFKSVDDLPLLETVAHCPMLMSTCLSTLASRSSTVGRRARQSAFRTFVAVTAKVHAFEASRLKRAMSSSEQRHAPPTSAFKTSVVTYAYHFVTNDLLFDGESSFPLAQALVEVFSLELGAFATMKQTQSTQTYAARISEMAWLLFDLILRGMYLDAIKSGASPAVRAPRSELYPHFFYTNMEKLVSEFVFRLVPTMEALVVVKRLAVFVRQAASVADRGMMCVVARTALHTLHERSCAANVDQFVKTLVEGSPEMAAQWLGVAELTPIGVSPLVKPQGGSPSSASNNGTAISANKGLFSYDAQKNITPAAVDAAPKFLLAVLMERICSAAFSPPRPTRIGALACAHHLILALSCRRDVISEDTLNRLACGMIPFVITCSQQYQIWHTQLLEKEGSMANTGSDGKSASSANTAERKQMLLVILWILGRVPPPVFRAWTSTLDQQPPVLNGLLRLMADVFTTFRFGGLRKDIIANRAEELALWEGRFSTAAALISTRVVSSILTDCPKTLRMARQETHVAAVHHFFVVLDHSVSYNNSTIALQCGSVLMLQTVQELFPEIISGAASKLGGMVLLTVRLLTSTSPAVRKIANRALLEMARMHYALRGSLTAFHEALSTALVSVAETQGLNTPRHGEYVVQALQEFAMAAQEPVSVLPPHVMNRFDPGMEITDVVSPQRRPAASDKPQVMLPPPKHRFTSTFERFNVSSAAKEKAETAARGGGEPFNAQATEMVQASTTLFVNVVALQSGAAATCLDVKALAFVDLIKTFLAQGAPAEAARWGMRLHDAFKASHAYAEAAAANVFVAALGFRMTQLFYHIHGSTTKGASLGATLVQETIQWHQYVRLLPELAETLNDSMLFPLVSNISALPNEKAFTSEGQVVLMRVAAEMFAKEQMYECSVEAIRIVDAIVWAADDVRSCAVIADAVRKWSDAISNPTRKMQSKYFCVTARGSLLPSDGRFQRIYRVRASQAKETDAHVFGSFALDTVRALCGISAPTQTEQQSPASEPVMLVSAGELDAVTQKARGGIPPGRVFVSCHEVTPHFDEHDPRLTSRRATDRTMFLDVFRSATRMADPARAAAAAAARAGMSRAQLEAMSSAAKALDVASQRLRVVVYHTERPFPSITPAIPLANVDSSTLDPEETAIETMRQEIEQFEASLGQHQSASSNSGEKEKDKSSKKRAPSVSASDRVGLLYSALTPLDIRPAGYYYKQVLLAFPASTIVVETVNEFATMCKTQLEKCDPTVDPEHYAAALKGVVDVECALAAAPAAQALSGSADRAAEAPSIIELEH